MQGQRAVVTGGAGFIGSHLSRALLDGGCSVRVLDDFSSGSEANLSGLEDRFSESLHVVRADIRDGEALRSAMQGVGVVFHLAALTSVEESIRAPQRFNAVNLDGTLEVLAAARNAGARRFVFASSAAVYGEQATLPVHEELAPRPASPYAVTKLASEYYCRLYEQVWELPAVCLRFFNVYGPLQAPDSPYAAAIPRFVQAFATRETPTIFGDGRQTRDFVYVGDVVRALLLAAAGDGPGGTFNVASGRATDLLELIEVLGHLAPPSLEPRFAPARQGEVRHSRGATARACERLGFEARVSLEAGLEQTLRWHAQQEAKRS